MAKGAKARRSHHMNYLTPRSYEQRYTHEKLKGLIYIYIYIYLYVYMYVYMYMLSVKPIIRACPDPWHLRCSNLLLWMPVVPDPHATAIGRPHPPWVVALLQIVC